MPDRQYSAATGYRYGFNGKEKDNEVVQYDYGFRIYDPRLVRFKSVDPLIKSYPWYSPYHFAGNNPIHNIDLDGLEESGYGQKLENQWIPALMKGKMTEVQFERNKMAFSIGGTAGLGAAAIVYTGGRALPYVKQLGTGLILWASRPENQQRVADVVNFGAELFNPNPEPLNPASPGGELGRLLRGLPKLLSLTGRMSKPLAVGLGKVKAGFLEFSKTHDLIDYQNWDNFFKFGKDALVDWSAKFRQSISETIEKGGKIIFNLDGVDKSIAQKGFDSFIDAKRAVNANGTLGQITEWELSQILRNDKWLNNTTFVKDGKIVDAAQEGLKLIK